MLVNAPSFPISGGRVPAEARGTGQQAKIRLLKIRAEEGEKQTRAKSRFADHIPAQVTEPFIESVPDSFKEFQYTPRFKFRSLVSFPMPAGIVPEKKTEKGRSM